MKKGFKKLLIVIAAIFLLFIGLALIYYIPMLLMPRPAAGQIHNTNIYVAKDMAGVFLIKANDGYIMIDAGMSKKNIEKSLKDANMGTNEVKWIFLTHSDGDHVGALTLFPNANIYMSKDEIPLVNGSVKRSFMGYTSLPDGISIDRIIPLSNGQELLLNGTKVKCISAPGHTIGSMLYLIDESYLFTGDAFKIKNGNITVHPYTMDKNLSKKTIEQLKETISKSKIVITSHYGMHYNN